MAQAPIQSADVPQTGRRSASGISRAGTGTSLFTQIKRLVPIALPRRYWQLLDVGTRSRNHLGYGVRVRSIHLARTLMGGDGGYDVGRWAELTGDLPRASTLLPHSPHVTFLEEYCRLGNAVLNDNQFDGTAYFANAVNNIKVLGTYFGQTTKEGLRAQARAFIALYERTRRADDSLVTFPSAGGHSAIRSLPIVRETLTRDTFQIVDGHHRLAIAYVLGQHVVRVNVGLPPAPTPLQALVLSVNQTQGRRELYQPIRGPEFDDSWGLVRRCADRFAMMVNFLTSHNVSLKNVSLCDLACSYGWFVSEFSKRGSRCVGVDLDPLALRIGQIAYGLDPRQLVQSDIVSFLSTGKEQFDVVLCLSVLHHFGLKSDFGSPQELLRKIADVTKHCLFLDMGQCHESWFHTLLPNWNDEFIIRLIRESTPFRRVVRLGSDSDDVGRYSTNYRRTLFACLRS